MGVAVGLLNEGALHTRDIADSGSRYLPDGFHHSVRWSRILGVVGTEWTSLSDHVWYLYPERPDGHVCHESAVFSNPKMSLKGA